MRLFSRIWMGLPPSLLYKNFLSFVFKFQKSFKFENICNNVFLCSIYSFTPLFFYFRDDLSRWLTILFKTLIFVFTTHLIIFSLPTSFPFSKGFAYILGHFVSPFWKVSSIFYSKLVSWKSFLTFFMKNYMFLKRFFKFTAFESKSNSSVGETLIGSYDFIIIRFLLKKIQGCCQLTQSPKIFFRIKNKKNVFELPSTWWQQFGKKMLWSSFL